MDALREMYAKVEKLDKEIAESDHKIGLCSVCRQLLETKIEHQNKMIRLREYWMGRIERRKVLEDFLQSKAAERKAKDEAEREAEEEAARKAGRKPAEEAERKAKEEAENAAKRRPIAKSNIAQKPRTREI